MSIRLIYFLGLVIVCLLIGSSIYIEITTGLIPCPLCILQRFCFFLLGIFFIVGILVYAKHWGRVLINILLALTTLAGMALAGRQIWLQHFHAANGNECGVSLQYMLQVLPLNEVFQKVFAGSAECTQRGWEFLSLNMPEWAFIWFTLILLLTIYLSLKELIKR